ncbi:hypothetical protein AB0L65_41635 [Nonomuraea sp. NPDC052116]|uniref:hypothetical protein n=1 Tax=Nonomuraea sp. NPDC052116 TaxID=3155665 RepID=UPI0034333CB8
MAGLVTVAVPVAVGAVPVAVGAVPVVVAMGRLVPVVVTVTGGMAGLVLVVAVVELVAMGWR